ncbi:hypothetical protein Hanom_Chr06g00486851 [Helianthus anomalus]
MAAVLMVFYFYFLVVQSPDQRDKPAIEWEREKSGGDGGTTIVSRRPPSWPSVRPMVGCGGLDA